MRYYQYPLNDGGVEIARRDSDAGTAEYFDESSHEWVQDTQLLVDIDQSGTWTPASAPLVQRVTGQFVDPGANKAESSIVRNFAPKIQAMITSDVRSAIDAKFKTILGFGTSPVHKIPDQIVARRERKIVRRKRLHPTKEVVIWKKSDSRDTASGIAGVVKGGKFVKVVDEHGAGPGKYQRTGPAYEIVSIKSGSKSSKKKKDRSST
ncbi:hypothetical protein [Aeromicrobium sp. 9AM]|uniref:hypothetical protein n=1 Tax=Aeromicrobium sp. 9AM TaxID=2653126 RepID=UPI0013585A90|nr:hypothetical protein [Aeromicrobium sp. 9AM]